MSFATCRSAASARRPTRPRCRSTAGSASIRIRSRRRWRRAISPTSQESAAIYAELGLVHPRDILRSCNFVISRNVLLGPWIHTGSRVQHLRAVPVGNVLSVRARITGNYEHKGHRFVEIDALVLTEGSHPGRADRAYRDLPTAPSRGSVIVQNPGGPAKPLALLGRCRCRLTTFAETSAAVPAVPPSIAICDLFGDAARLELTESVADRGERDRHAFLALDRAADLGRAQRPRRIRLQYLFDKSGIRAALRPASICRSPPGRARGIARLLRTIRRARALH